jgi:hypothetical protein
MIQSPTDLANRSIDALGLPERIIGDINDGEPASELARRHYGPLLRQLLRTAHWSFARFSNSLQILADATGATLTPQGTPISNQVEAPWLYCYAWPIDCVQPIWLPWNGLTSSTPSPPGNLTQGFTPTQPGVPLMPGLNNLPTFFSRLAPARFLSSTSAAFPTLVGQASWQAVADAMQGEGVGIRRRRVILTNVPPTLDMNQNPVGPPLVYTGLAVEPSLWDSLFEMAFVAVLAERFAPTLMVDPEASADDMTKQRAAMLQVRAQQIAIAKDAIREARVASANEAGFPQNAVHQADWIRAHRIYGPGGAGWGSSIGDGPGYYWGGWDGFAFGSGEIF